MITSILAPILALNIFSYIPWTSIFLITPLIGIRLYYIKKDEECLRIQNRLKTYSHVTDGGKGYGYSCGFWYFLYLSGGGEEQSTVYMVATENSYKSLTSETKEESISLFEQGWAPPSVTEETKIQVVDRSGSYAHIWFRKRVKEAKDVPMGQQGPIVKSIINDYMKRRHTVAFIHGNPGTGKSMVGILVASEFASYFCNTFKPWQPGDTLGLLISEVEPTPQKPLIIVFDEIDLVFSKIKDGIPLHKNIPTLVADKSGWNHMLDSIQRGMYPNVILIITSNYGPDYIDAIDSSFIRKGRVDLTFEMTESLI